MKCNDIKLELSQYLKGELPSEEENTISDHLQFCEECQAELEMIKEMEEIFNGNKIKLNMPNTTEKRMLKKINNVKRTSYIRKVGSLVAAVLIVALITTASISPAFAEFISNIPGISHILEFINYDATLTRAIENDMMQPIDEVFEHNGMKIHFEGLVADDSNIILFYSIENLTSSVMESRAISFENFKIGDKEHPTSSSTQYILDINPGETKRSTTRFHYNHEGKEKQVTLDETVTVDAFVSKLSDTSDDKKDYLEEYLTTLELNIDVERFEKLTETIDIDEEILVEGQKVYVEKIVIKPTEAILVYSVDENNTKEILQNDFELMDDKGNRYKSKGGFHTGSVSSEKLESPIFVDYKELYLVGKSFNAVDKDSTEFVVDLKKEKIIRGPKDINFTEIIYNNHWDERMGITLSCPKDTWVSNIYHDIEGNEYDSSFGVSLGPDHITLWINPDELKSDQIIFQLINYHTTINEEFKIRLK
ncbi:DUF4179 domain-containing protein [Alkalicella caledoniensis]|uniref:Anti-sigma-W factor RsiW n=1 Tax=Alkalicella caledoniensis TaxID=2731377 RepID=A0A7G9W7C6_ALKCA|nr:DUF4179 domain-containing protein [Alkalicella caledoniensis]QNO14588.1 DUF4179 domain-containing protein [Alkalicella caledoniensis]